MSDIQIIFGIEILPKFHYSLVTIYKKCNLQKVQANNANRSYAEPKNKKQQEVLHYILEVGQE